MVTRNKAGYTANVADGWAGADMRVLPFSARADGRTNGRTKPPIESRVRDQKKKLAPNLKDAKIYITIKKIPTILIHVLIHSIDSLNVI